MQAVAEMNNLIAVLRDLKENVDEHHSKWFAEVEEMCKSDTSLKYPS